MPVIFPRLGRSSVTASSRGARKGTAPFMGREDTPDSRGRMLPSATKAHSPSSGSFWRIYCWSSASWATARSRRPSRPEQHRVSCTHLGRKSNKIFSSSRALMVRPLAGKPTSRRSSTSPRSGSRRQAVRSSTSGPQRLTEIRPLWPEPLAWKENWAARRPNWRVSSSWRARRRHRVSYRARGKPAVFPLTWMLSLEGAAKGSPCTWSMDSTYPGNWYAPRVSL